MTRRAVQQLRVIRDGFDPDHPPYLHPDYRSTELRAPKRPLLILSALLSLLFVAASRSASSTTISPVSMAESRSVSGSS